MFCTENRQIEFANNRVTGQFLPINKHFKVILSLSFADFNLSFWYSQSSKIETIDSVS